MDERHWFKKAVSLAASETDTRDPSLYGIMNSARAQDKEVKHWKENSLPLIDGEHRDYQTAILASCNDQAKIYEAAQRSSGFLKFTTCRLRDLSGREESRGCKAET